MWFWQDTASWQDFAALSAPDCREASKLRRKFWRKAETRSGRACRSPRNCSPRYYCAFDRNTPLYVKGVLVGAIVYFVVPDRFHSRNTVSLIGLADDAAVLAAAFKAVSSHIKPEHRRSRARALARLRAADACRRSRLTAAARSFPSPCGRRWP